MTEEKFLEMCRKHDITYQYEDDSRNWRRGVETYNKIVEASKVIGEEAAARIWNQVVDEKIREDSRSNWYWD